MLYQHIQTIPCGVFELNEDTKEIMQEYYGLSLSYKVDISEESIAYLEELGNGEWKWWQYLNWDNWKFIANYNCRFIELGILVAPLDGQPGKVLGMGDGIQCPDGTFARHTEQVPICIYGATMAKPAVLYTNKIILSSLPTEDRIRFIIDSRWYGHYKGFRSRFNDSKVNPLRLGDRIEDKKLDFRTITPDTELKKLAYILSLGKGFFDTDTKMREQSCRQLSKALSTFVDKPQCQFLLKIYLSDEYSVCSENLGKALTSKELNEINRAQNELNECIKQQIINMREHLKSEEGSELTDAQIDDLFDDYNVVIWCMLVLCRSFVFDRANND